MGAVDRVFYMIQTKYRLLTVSSSSVVGFTGGCSCGNNVLLQTKDKIVMLTVAAGLVADDRKSNPTMPAMSLPCRMLIIFK